MTSINIELPADIHDRAKILAQRDGLSVDQLVAAALSEKLAALDAHAYFMERAARGSREAFDRAMDQIPARPPLPGDERPAE